MALVHRVVAVYLIAVAFAVWANLIATPLYHDGSPEYPVWQIINYFMAVGVVIMLVKAFMMRQARDAQSGGSGDPIAHLRVSIAFYGAIILAMIYFWGWFWTLNPASETGDAVTSHLIYFPVGNSLFIVLALLIGQRCWQDGKSA